MKKVLLIVFLIGSLNCFSQSLEKGDKLFGGSFSFSVFNVNNGNPVYYTGANVGVLPSYSWIIRKDLALGIRGAVSYNRTVNKQTATGKRISTALAIGPSVFLKKYRSIKEKFGIYFDHDAGFVYSRNSDKTGPTSFESKSAGISYKFSPGVFYRFSNRFIGEGNIGGMYTSYFYGDSDNNAFGIGASFLQYFNLGINYVIRKNKS